jgi:phosphatidylserine/phosphatidylglycerophosphate/cardiolipin synthase-like enzyme
LRHYCIDDEITVGTVHALQGAGRDIIIFSPVHTADDGKDPFFDRGPNLINVAVSRARQSFLVFGDMRMFNPARRSSPSGLLAAYLFGCGTEIRDVLSRPEFIRGANRDYTRRIESLEAHRATLEEALTHAVNRVLIVSPYISQTAIRDDNVPKAISSARSKNVRILVVFDPELNREEAVFRESARQGIALLKAAGAEVGDVMRIHSKTLAVDDKWIVEGSFNWLSAKRNSNSCYARQERSLRYDGPLTPEFCNAAWTEVLDSGTQARKVSSADRGTGARK